MRCTHEISQGLDHASFSGCARLANHCVPGDSWQTRVRKGLSYRLVRAPVLPSPSGVGPKQAHEI